MANFIIPFIASSAIGHYQRRKAKQRAAAAQRQLLEAQREANAIEARPSHTNQPIPIIYGRAGVPGSPIYSQVGKLWRNNTPENATDVRISGDAGFEIDEAQERNTVLLRQYVIAIGKLHQVTYCLIDGEPFDADRFDNAKDIKWGFGDNRLVISGGMSDVGGEERKPSDVRFTGLTFATAGFLLDLDDPEFAGQFPELFFYCSGIDMPYLIRNGADYVKQAPDESVFPYENKRSNPVLALYDYLTQHSHFGPNLPESKIHTESFAFASAQCVDRICHANALDLQSSVKYDPVVTGGQFTPLKNVFWTRPYPAVRNQVAGTNHAAYWNNFIQYTSISNVASQCDGLLPDDEANRFGGINQVINRYEFNGRVSTTRKFFDAIGLFRGVIPGAQFFRSITGRWKFIIPNPLQSLSNIPVFNEFRGNFEEVRPDADELANRITARFSDIEKDFAGGVVEFPTPGSPLDIQLQESDGGVFRLSIDIVGANNRQHAISISANLILIRRREVYRFTVPKKYLLYEQGDVIIIDRKRHPKVFVYAIIIAKRPNPDLSITFVARRFSRADYDIYLSDQERIPLTAEIPAIPFIPFSAGTPTAPPPVQRPPVQQVPGTPGKPASVTITHHTISVSWDAPTTGGAVDTFLSSDYYEADISTTDDFASPITKTTNNRAIAFDGLTELTTYYIRVRARNVRGFGAYSDALQVDTIADTPAPTPDPDPPVQPDPPAQAPGAPGTPTLDSKTDKSITIDWTAPTTGGEFDASQSSDSYQVQGSTSSTFAAGNFTLSTSNLTATFGNLTADTPYYFRVRARNSTGYGNYSNALGVTTNSAPPQTPGAPGTPTLSSKSNTSIAVGWTAPTSGAAFDATLSDHTYIVEVSATADFARITVSSNTNSASHTFTGLTPDTTYYVRVRTKTEAGQGANSASLSVKTDPDPPDPPGAPGTPTSSAKTHSTVTLTWTAPTTGGAFDATKTSDYYIVEGSLTANFARRAVSTTARLNQHQFTGLTRNTKYYFRVRARNSDGNGPWSASLTVTTDDADPNPPGAPGTPTSSAKTHLSITVDWTAPTDGGEFDTMNFNDFYLVYASPNADFVNRVPGENKSGSSRRTSFRFTGLDARKLYYIRVRARNSDGNGPFSGVLEVTTNPDPKAVPGAPGKPALTSLSVGITVSWTAPTTGGPFDASQMTDSYTLQIATMDDFSNVKAQHTTNTSATQHRTGIRTSSGQTYYARVRAVNTNGAGAWSEVLQVDIP